MKKQILQILMCLASSGQFSFISGMPGNGSHEGQSGTEETEMTLAMLVGLTRTENNGTSTSTTPTNSTSGDMPELVEYYQPQAPAGSCPLATSPKSAFRQFEPKRRKQKSPATIQRLSQTVKDGPTVDFADVSSHSCITVQQREDLQLKEELKALFEKHAKQEKELCQAEEKRWKAEIEKKAQEKNCGKW